MSLSIWKDVGVAKQTSLKRRILGKLITVLHLPQLLNLDRKAQRYRIDNLLQKIDYFKSDYCINMLGDYELREIVPTKMYGEPCFREFEGIEVACPADSNGVLEIIYGDYMKLPPAENRVWKHCMDIIEEDYL